MIKTWANSRSRQFYEKGKNSKFRSLTVAVADDLLAILDSATASADLSPLKKSLIIIKDDSHEANPPWAYFKT